MNDFTPEPGHPQLPPDELIKEFMATLHALWDFQVEQKSLPKKAVLPGCDPYTPIQCPGSGGGGGLPAMCNAINAWAACWKAWGDEVHKKLFPNPDDPPPPPGPPFI